MNEIIMVIRTFPIRVGGNSGRLLHEISWEEIQRISGAPQPLPEYTSVTRRLRRVAAFDVEAVKVACRYNRPTALAIMGCDRLDNLNHGIRSAGRLLKRTTQFVDFVEKTTGVPVRWLGTGFGTFDAIHVDATAAVIGNANV